MEDYIIIRDLKKALVSFSQNDSWLIKNGLSERSIAHRIALHLTLLFKEYHVDCEYNGDIDSENLRKKISFSAQEAQIINLISSTNIISDDDIISRSVFPDIIIHERGSHNKNLCAIEIKKTSSNVPREYDELKLKCYTSNQRINNLKYQLGVFIEIGVNNLAGDCNIKYFKNGVFTNEETVKLIIPQS